MKSTHSACAHVGTDDPVTMHVDRNGLGVIQIGTLMSSHTTLISDDAEAMEALGMAAMLAAARIRQIEAERVAAIALEVAG